MNLIEIVKGMANASEAINENFEKLGFELQSNENGTYFKHASGLVLAFGNDLVKIPSTSGDGVRITFPIAFASEPDVFLSSHNNVCVPSINSLTIDGVNIAVRTWTDGTINNVPIRWFAIGFVEE